MRLSALTVLLVLLTACGEKAPPCSYTGEPILADSAGCLIFVNDRLLLVETRYGGFGPPAGNVSSGESAQCAAERETFEETGITVSAGELAMAMDNGFHLFWCEPAGSLQPAVHRPLEIAKVDWFSPAEFKDLPWRYTGQARLFTELLSQEPGAPANPNIHMMEKELDDEQ